jgi:hypothetical protein
VRRPADAQARHSASFRAHACGPAPDHMRKAMSVSLRSARSALAAARIARNRIDGVEVGGQQTGAPAARSER